MDKYSGMNKVCVKLSRVPRAEKKPRRVRNVFFAFTGVVLIAVLAVAFFALKNGDKALYDVIKTITGALTA